MPAAISGWIRILSVTLNTPLRDLGCDAEGIFLVRSRDRSPEIDVAVLHRDNECVSSIVLRTRRRIVWSSTLVSGPALRPIPEAMCSD
jgi:hypothetical protein